MFDNRWDNWIGDFQDSFAATQLDPAVREYVPEILTHFGAAVRTRDPNFPDEVSPGTFVAVMSESMPRLKLPDEAREFVPDVIAAFLDSLEDTGRVGEGRDWGAQVRILAISTYLKRLAPEGGVKGVTIRRAPGVAPIGRNDPCPCGSGKKFKKCCMARGA